MAGFFTATPEQLTQAANEMETKNTELNTQLTNFLNTAQGTSGAWQGNAATAFQNLSMRFKEDADRMNEALRQMSEQMAGTSRDYAAQDANAQEGMSGIMNALGGGA